jgi:hypothetical protein
MTKTIEQARADLAAANAALLSEMEADSTRREGSDAQERRREAHQDKLRDRVAQCEYDLLQLERAGREVPPLVVEVEGASIRISS